jgi:hypothetical protein
MLLTEFHYCRHKPSPYPGFMSSRFNANDVPYLYSTARQGKHRGMMLALNAKPSPWKYIIITDNLLQSYIDPKTIDPCVYSG